jgi:hypothetical protein
VKMSLTRSSAHVLRDPAIRLSQKENSCGVRKCSRYVGSRVVVIFSEQA